MNTSLPDLLQRRASIRAFDDRPVPQDILDRLLELALQAPSWSNTQPYRLAVAQGALRDELAADLTARFDAGQRLMRLPKWRRFLEAVRDPAVRPRSDYPIPHDYPPDLVAARRATGFGLYKLLGIERNDHAARTAQMRRNFHFFDAPCVIFIFAHAGLGVYSVLDAGIFLQSLMLAATDAGLGTCAQGALATWSEPVRQRFEVPDSYRLVCGLALGYPADAKVNSFRPGRQALQEFLLPPRQT